MPYIDVPMHEYSAWRNKLLDAQWFAQEIRFSVAYDPFMQDYRVFAMDMHGLWEYEELISDFAHVDHFKNRAWVDFKNHIYERIQITYGPDVTMIDQGLLNAVVV